MLYLLRNFLSILLLFALLLLGKFYKLYNTEVAVIQNSGKKLQESTYKQICLYIKYRAAYVYQLIASQTFEKVNFN